MQRYFLDKIDNTITNSNAHHIKNVMRMKLNDKIVVCADNKCFNARITKIETDVSYEVIDEIIASRMVDITIIQGLPKSNKTEDFIKYATLFGASSLIITPMKRSIAKLSNEDKKINRYNLIAKEASELARRYFVPSISFANKITDINFDEFDYKYLADEEETSYMMSNIDKNNLTNKKVLLVIGPEGGISSEERLSLTTHGFERISLGNLILPTELAAIKFLSYFID